MALELIHILFSYRRMPAWLDRSIATPRDTWDLALQRAKETKPRVRHPQQAAMAMGVAVAAAAVEERAGLPPE